MTTAPPPYQPNGGAVTPDDYIKYQPSIQLPLGDHRHVGLLACQRDPLLQRLSTEIFSSNLFVLPPPTKGTKSAKTRKAATETPSLSPTSDTKIYEIECLDTCLFPEGGGQPSDSGVMIVENGLELKVAHVLRKGRKAIHFVEVPEGKQLLIGAGSKVELRVDWQRRMDLMTTHTSQHLLSSLLDAISIPTLSWSLTPYPNPCYIEIPRAPTLEEITQIELRANELIREATKVWVEVEDQNQKQETEEARKSSKSMPKDYEGGVVRTVVIDGVDRNPCCGTHVPYLSLLQSLHIIPTTTPHSSTTRRLYFLTSARLTLYIQKSTLLLSSLSTVLGGASAETLPARVEALVESSKSTDKALKSIKNELAGLIAKDIKADRKGEGEWIKVVHREANEGTTGLDFLGAVSTAIWDDLTKGEKGLLILSAMPTPFVATSTSTLHLSGTPELVSAFGEAIKQVDIFKGRIKGGGAKGRWQAKVEGKLGEEEVAVLNNAALSLRK
ncbi:Predicted metal-dependent hydrolase, contains AlaS domain [Phaffia rhodozyma]|uniref:Predicted metal-dependent hydrolase, contains AlaS domain n=1 Tax=Phaffia rhodozyma TaxID=264483 RepID=A0A0F7SJQ5_PHARH|nr:Predicted metal-dependent hydrolase, contains AlaS domain [Phaffia rhodozyma]